MAALTWVGCPGHPRPTGDRGTSYTMLVLALPGSQVPSWPDGAFSLQSGLHRRHCHTLDVFCLAHPSVKTKESPG